MLLTRQYDRVRAVAIRRDVGACAKPVVHQFYGAGWGLYQFCIAGTACRMLYHELHPRFRLVLYYANRPCAGMDRSRVLS